MKGPRSLLLAVLILGKLYAQDIQGPLAYRWAILPFDVGYSEWQNLGKNLSEIISRVDLNNELRQLEDSERLFLEKSTRENRITQLLARESSARLELDRIRLRSDASNSAYVQAEQNYQKVRTERLQLENADLSIVSVPERLPLLQVPGPNQLLSGSSSPGTLFHQNRLNLLIVPKLLKVRDYLGIVVEVWNENGKTERRYEEWMSPEEVLDRISLVQDWLTNSLLNRPWSRLKMITDPPHAEIWIDGRLRGLGAADLGILEPGSFRVIVRAGGYQSIQEVVEVARGQSLVKEWRLQPRENFKRRIITEPPEARVWIGGRYRGLTPLEILGSDEPQYLEIELAGFNPIARTIWPEENEINLNLEPSTEERKLDEARSWFYVALGSFTVTFFTYILFRGLEYEYLQLSNDYLKNYLDTPVGFRTQEQLDKVNLSYTFQQTFQNGGYALLGVTVALFGWTVWELFRYIDVAERGR